tara:strand:- start:263 stop:595 length:333 start_codon:yes stop_codon:yes gene_type:complete
MGNCLGTDNKICFVCNDNIQQPKYLHCKKCHLNYHFVCLLHATRGVECCTQCYKKLDTIKEKDSFIYENKRSLSINSQELNGKSELTFSTSNSYKSIKSSKYGKASILNQ